MKFSAFSFFKNSRFVFKEKPTSTPEQVEKSNDIENTGYRLQKKFTEAVTKFKAHAEESERRADSMNLHELIQAYRGARDILGSVAREIHAFLQKHPEQKILLVNSAGDKIQAIESIEKGREMNTLEWAKIIGAEKSTEALMNRIYGRTQKLLAVGTAAIQSFELQDAKVFESQIASAENFDDLESSSSAFQAAEKTFAEYGQSARELQSLLGKESPIGLSLGELSRQINALQTGTLARLDEKYKTRFDRILAEKTGPDRNAPQPSEESSEDVYRREIARVKAAAETETPEEKPETKHGWDPATGHFNLSAREFQYNTLGKYFNDFAISVNGRIAARVFKEDAEKNKNLKVGEYYYTDSDGGLTSKRALLTKNTIVTKDVPDDIVVKILAKNSEMKKSKKDVADPGEPK